MRGERREVSGERYHRTTLLSASPGSRLYLPIVDKVRGEKRSPCPNWGVCRQGEQ